MNFPLLPQPICTSSVPQLDLHRGQLNFLLFPQHRPGYVSRHTTNLVCRDVRFQVPALHTVGENGRCAVVGKKERKGLL
jgi:hypothetical protein